MRRFKDVAPRLFANGYVPVAVGGGHADKTIPSKGFSWGVESYQPEHDLEERLPKYGDDFTSVRLDGLVCLDLDVDDPATQEALVALASETCGKTEFVRKSPTRVALFYRQQGEFSGSGATPRFTVGDFRDQQVEVFAGPVKIMAAYTVHKSGQEYQWPERSLVDHPRTELPAVTRDAVNLFLTHACDELSRRAVINSAVGSLRLIWEHREADIDPAILPMVDTETIERALSFLHPDDFDHDERVRIMHAALGAYGEGRKDDAVEAWMRWRSQETDFSYKDDKKQRSNWLRSRPPRIGWRQLRALAVKHGFKDEKKDLLYQNVPAVDPPPQVTAGQADRELRTAIDRWARPIVRVRKRIDKHQAIIDKLKALIESKKIDNSDMDAGQALAAAWEIKALERKVKALKRALGKHRALIQITMGSGKTRVALAQALELARSGLIVWYLVPTNDLLDEIETIVEDMGGREHLSVFRGRLRDGPDGSLMAAESLCARPKAMSAYMRSGRTNVAQDMCLRFEPDASGGPARRLMCRHFENCRYQAQAKQSGKLIVLAQEYMHLTVSTHFIPNADAWIVDDLNPASLLTKEREIIIRTDDLARWPVIQAALREARSGHPGRALRTAGVTPEELLEVARQLEEEYEAKLPCVIPIMDDPIVERELAKPKPPAPCFALLRRIVDEWGSMDRRPHLYSARAELDSEGREIWITQYRRGIHRARANLPILFLDGTPSVPLLEIAFGKLRVTKIDVALNAEIFHIWGDSFSRDRMLRPQLQELVGDAIKGLLETGRGWLGYGPETRVLVLCDKQLVSPLREAIGEHRAIDSTRGDVLGAAVEVHHLPVRGLDRWRDFDIVVVVGRIFPNVRDLEQNARAYLYDTAHDVTEVGEKQYPKEPRAFLMLDHEAGDAREGRSAYYHPDPTVEEFRRLTQESEILQGLHRLRLVHRKRLAKVIILGDQPILDLQVNQLLHVDSFMTTFAGRPRGAGRYDRRHGWTKGGRLGAAFAASGGRLLLSPVFLATRFTSLWDTPKAAKMEIENARKARTLPGDANSTAAARGIVVGSAAIRLAGQRGSADTTLLYTDELSGALAWVEEVTGRRVERVNGVARDDLTLSAFLEAWVELFGLGCMVSAAAVVARVWPDGRDPSLSEAEERFREAYINVANHRGGAPSPSTFSKNVRALTDAVHGGLRLTYHGGRTATWGVMVASDPAS